MTKKFKDIIRRARLAWMVFKHSDRTAIRSNDKVKYRVGGIGGRDARPHVRQ